VTLPGLTLRNAFMRNKTRTFLTILGVVITTVAFLFLRTILTAWYASAEASSADRVVTRNAVSLINPLPISYAARLAQIPGVTKVTWSNWFGGIYKDRKSFFAQFAIDGPTALEVFSLRFLQGSKQDFLADRNSCLVGKGLAEKYGWKVGETIPLFSEIYPGDWKFRVAAVIEGTDDKSVANVMYFHWARLNETQAPNRKDTVGVFTATVANASDSPRVMTVVTGTREVRTGWRAGSVEEAAALVKKSATAKFDETIEIHVRLGIDPKQFDDYDMHIHFPEGAVPKDGPSAGITIVMAIASALAEAPIRNDVAMTGEVTLRGKVIAVGGLKEKVMAAYRAGIKTVIFPADNQKDLVEVPEPIRAKMTFLPVAFVDEVFQHAFAGVAERIAELEARAAKRRARIAARRRAARRGKAGARRGKTGARRAKTSARRRKPAARAAHARRIGRRPRATPRRAASPR